MAKILVTGGSGFIGHYVVKELSELGHRVVVYDSFATYFPETSHIYRKNLQDRLKSIRDRAEVVRGDLTDKDFLLSVFKEHQPELVIHLANIPVANASNRFSGTAIEVNLLGTGNIIEAVRATPSVRRLIYASSSYVYGNFEYEPAGEPPN